MIPIISSGLNIIVSITLFVWSSMALLCVNFSFNKRVLWVPLSNILTMANPEISSINGAFTFINFCSLGFKIVQFSGNMGTDLFQNLKQQSLEFITSSNSNNSLYLRPSQRFHEILIPVWKSQIYVHVHL